MATNLKYYHEYIISLQNNGTGIAYNSIDLSAEAMANNADRVLIRIKPYTSGTFSVFSWAALGAAIFEQARVSGSPGTPRLFSQISLADSSSSWTGTPLVQNFSGGGGYTIFTNSTWLTHLKAMDVIALSTNQLYGNGSTSFSTTEGPLLGLLWVKGSAITQLSLDIIMPYFSNTTFDTTLCVSCSYFNGANDPAGICFTDPTPYAGLGQFTLSTSGGSSTMDVNLKQVNGVSVTTSPVPISGTLTGVTNAVHTILDSGVLTNVTTPIHSVLDSGVVTSVTTPPHVIVDAGTLTGVTNPVHTILDSGALTSVTMPIHSVLDSGVVTSITNPVHSILDSGVLTTVTNTVPTAGGSAGVNDPQHPLYVCGL
jgi:hypothetical protein